MKGEAVTVEAYAGARYPERPLRVLWRGRWRAVKELTAQWQEPERRCFVVILEDDTKAVLCYYQGADAWELRLAAGGG